MAVKPYFHKNDGPPPLSGRLLRRVRLEEVDALGIMWHGRYPSYLEDGREELGRSYGFGYHAFAEAGVALPLRTLHLDYLSPLRYAEEVAVETILHWHDGARLNTEYNLYGGDGRLACRAYSVQMMLDRSGEILLEAPPLFRAIREKWRDGSLIPLAER